MNGESFEGPPAPGVCLGCGDAANVCSSCALEQYASGRLDMLREVREVLLSYPTLRLRDDGSFIDADRACAGIDRLEAAERAKGEDVQMNEIPEDRLRLAREALSRMAAKGGGK